MLIGCLTGNGKRTPLHGAYTYHAPGLVTPLAPDLLPDLAPGSGPFSFFEGALTDGDAATGVGWRAATTGETGVDVVLRLGTQCFVDHVVVHQPTLTHSARSDADGIEAIGHVGKDGLSGVEVYAMLPGGGLALVGRVGGQEPDALPEGSIAVRVGVEAAELVVRLLSCRRDVRVAELEIWGAGPGEPGVFPVPARMEHLAGPPFELSPDSTIWIGSTASDDAWFVATMLRQKLHETFDLDVSIDCAAEPTCPPDLILVGRPGTSTHLASIGLPEQRVPGHFRQLLLLAFHPL